MRIAILADIHSNLAAFEAVSRDFEPVDQVWCLGDVVGYGPEPNECVEMLRSWPHLCVAGNHDWAAVGKVDAGYFNPEAEAACRWTGQQLSPENRRYLAELPVILEQELFTLAHGSPRQPIWEYLLNTADARANFASFRTRYCLVGHSHVPVIFALTPNARGKDHCLVVLPVVDDPVPLDAQRMIINPGGVGQPRDGNPDASYILYDTDTGALCYRRVPYDIESTQRKMQARGLPARLWIRLSYGQ